MGPPTTAVLTQRSVFATLTTDIDCYDRRGTILDTTHLQINPRQSGLRFQGPGMDGRCCWTSDHAGGTSLDTSTFTEELPR